MSGEELGPVAGAGFLITLVLLSLSAVVAIVGSWYYGRKFDAATREFDAVMKRIAEIRERERS